MGSSALVAPHSFNQLAEDAFSEDLYEAGLKVVDDIASHGFYPEESLVRHVTAIALVSSSSSTATSPKSSRRAKASANTARRDLARPSNEAILAATSILARLARLLDVDVVLDAFPPASSPVKPLVSSRAASKKRSRSSHGNEESSEEDHATASSSRTKIVADGIGRADNIWHVLRLEELGSKKASSNGDYGGSMRKKVEVEGRRIKTRKRSSQEDDDDGVNNSGSSAYNREAAWRVLDVLVTCWRRQRTDMEAAPRHGILRSSLHLAQQFPEPKKSSLGERGSRRSGKNDGREGNGTGSIACTEIGEAIEVVLTGLVPPRSGEKALRTKLSQKAKLVERHRRATTATRLLIELLHLGRLGLLDKDALVRRIVTILDEADDLSLDIVFEEIRRENETALLDMLVRAMTLYFAQTSERNAHFDQLDDLIIVEKNVSESISELSRLLLASPAPKTIERFLASDVIEAKDDSEENEELAKEMGVMRDTWSLSTNEVSRKRRGGFSKVSSFSSSTNGSSNGSGGARHLGSSQPASSMPSKTQRSACIQAIALTAATRLAELHARLKWIRFAIAILDLMSNSSTTFPRSIFSKDANIDAFVEALKTLYEKVQETKESMEGVGRDKMDKLVDSFVVGKPRHIEALRYRALYEDVIRGFEHGAGTLQGYVDVGEIWVNIAGKDG